MRLCGGMFGCEEEWRYPRDRVALVVGTVFVGAWFATVSGGERMGRWRGERVETGMVALEVAFVVLIEAWRAIGDIIGTRIKRTWVVTKGCELNCTEFLVIVCSRVVCLAQFRYR